MAASLSPEDCKQERAQNSSNQKRGHHVRNKSAVDSVNFHESDDGSDDETFLGRESTSKPFEIEKQNRLQENSHLSTLTSQIMELIVDNIRMVHMNTKLIDYCKQQNVQASATNASLIKTIEGDQNTKTETEDRIKDLKLELEEKHEKVRLYGFLKLTTISVFSRESFYLFTALFEFLGPRVE